MVTNVYIATQAEMDSLGTSLGGDEYTSGEKKKKKGTAEQGCTGYPAFFDIRYLDGQDISVSRFVKL